MSNLNLTLQPVDAVRVTTLVDNVSDTLLMDQGPAKRVGLMSGGAIPRIPAPTLEGGEAIDGLLAEHGFSALITISKGGRDHQILFDTGMTPDGLIENMRRLNLSPKDIEAVLLATGTSTTRRGCRGSYARSAGRIFPVIIHPDFWTRRRIAIPGRDAIELPSTSRSALVGAGFEIIEERAPSFLLEGAMLITGEVDRTSEFERGFPVH